MAIGLQTCGDGCSMILSDWHCQYPETVDTHSFIFICQKYRFENVVFFSVAYSIFVEYPILLHKYTKKYEI